MVVISDGIVQDADATLQAIEDIQSQGFAITTIGVGDEFDEEFLMKAADVSRGDYHYAADIGDITARLDQEMTTLETTTITDLYLAARGLDGTVIQDIFSVRPVMTMFEEIFHGRRLVAHSASATSPARLRLGSSSKPPRPSFRRVPTLS